MRARTLWIGGLLATMAGCSAPAEQVRTAGGAPRPSATARASAAPIDPSMPPPNPHRFALGTPIEEALPVELAPMSGGARVLAIADEAERGAFARTTDPDGALGKIRWFEGAHVVTAFETSDGRAAFVTSDGDRLCVATFTKDADTPGSQGCATIRPEVVVPIGDRLALVSLDITETKTLKTRPTSKPKSAGGVKKADGAKKSDAKGDGAKKADAKKNDAKKKPATTSAKKPKPKPAKAGVTKKRRGSETVAIPSQRAKVDLRVAWAGADGAFDPASAPIGVTFERPLSGMMIADVAPRGAGADLLFYESVAKPAKPSKTQLGSARFGIASIGADGKVVEGSRGTLAEADLEYGYLTGQNAPRLVSSPQGTALVTFAGRAGACQASRVFPTLGPAVLPKPSCQIDPLGSVLSGTTVTASPPGFTMLLATEPRRAPGQTRSDAPLVAWAGDRAMFVSATGFGIMARDRADFAAAKAPFVAKRSRLAWSAFAPDGEGIALVSGSVLRVDADGAVAEAVTPKTMVDALGSKTSEIVQRAEGRSDDTRRAARIGDAFFFARGDVVRLTPEPMRIDALAGRAIADASVLVGGRERGLFLEHATSAMRVTFVAKTGVTSAGPWIASPVRAGFDAVERASGGAIVAGVSAADPTKVIAFTLDDTGKPSATRATSLTKVPGAFGVRLVPLPKGGALLFDRDRRRAVWLDDDANERAAAPLPPDRARASCIDGRPAPLALPSPDPGRLVTVADLSEPGTCVRGDLAWTPSGALRWFGSTARGLDSIAELGALSDVLSPPSTAPISTAPISTSDPSTAATSTSDPSTAATSTAATSTAATSTAATSTAAISPSAVPAPPGKLVCPGDMVSIAGRFCIDRFESTLVDGKTGRVLSPDFPGTPNLLEIVLGDWATDRAHWGDVHARAFPLPDLPAWQRGAKTEPVAVPIFGARPNGYVTGLVAEGACTAAGKRLCSLDEFTTACRGEDETDFPYGAEYQDGVCNVFREDHPAALLHHNASFGHLDPRLNRVRAKGRPLFEIAGARPACRSVWGDDAVYDLVGNLDEWVDEGNGAFAGGFYARSTRAGCDAVITAHPKVYADYSTGVRCCKDSEK